MSRVWIGVIFCWIPLGKLLVSLIFWTIFFMKLLYYLGKTQQKLTEMTPKNLEKIYDSVNGSLKGSLNMIQKQPKSIKIQRVDPLISQKLTLFWTVFPRVLFKKVEFLLKLSFTLGKQVEVGFLRKNESRTWIGVIFYWIPLGKLLVSLFFFGIFFMKILYYLGKTQQTLTKMTRTKQQRVCEAGNSPRTASLNKIKKQPKSMKP